MGADAPPVVSLPRCKMWWTPSPGTTCWRWGWAELLLFAPLAPGFHKSLFLTLKEWCGLQMQSGRAEASIGIYGEVIYTGKTERGGVYGATCPIPESTPISRRSTVSLPALWSCAGLLQGISRAGNYYFVLVAVLNLTKILNAFMHFAFLHHFPQQHKIWQPSHKNPAKTSNFQIIFIFMSLPFLTVRLYKK